MLHDCVYVITAYPLFLPSDDMLLCISVSYWNIPGACLVHGQKQMLFSPECTCALWSRIGLLGSFAEKGRHVLCNSDSTMGKIMWENQHQIFFFL